MVSRKRRLSPRAAASKASARKDIGRKKVVTGSAASAAAPAPAAAASKPAAAKVVAKTQARVPAPDLRVFKIGASLSIHDVGAQRRELQNALDHGVEELDVTALEAIDTAGVQLLLAVAAAANVRGGALRFTGADKLLLGAAQALGLGTPFGAPTEAAS